MMDEFLTHYDIFATKGAEYLVIIVFLIVVVAFWKFVSMKPY